ncbi:MAG: aminopeptidase [Bacteroidetes bacterium]|nr:aminopeptidase [Bacteroidota bacterium]
MKIKNLLLIIAASVVYYNSYSQTRTNKKGSQLQFTLSKELAATNVKNQQSSGTCWCFSTNSFLESEIIRMGKGTHDIAEMFTVRNMYLLKGRHYLRYVGKTQFADGGEPHDVMAAIRDYGMLPQNAYDIRPGYNPDKISTGEMESVLKGMLDNMLALKDGRLSPAAIPAFEAAVNAYLGVPPAEFVYEGKKYTPKTFVNALGINPDDYVEITSFTHHPFYSKFILEVPDNWMNGYVYNVTLEELKSITDNAISNGYTIAWASDVSEKGFNYKSGLAIVPEKNYDDMSKEEKDSLFLKPCIEKAINQQNRQEAFDNLSTQDDHGMHITGTAQDQFGKKYYLVKNSWGTDQNECGGYFYCSEAYFMYKTTAIMVHKNAISKEISKKLGL